MRQGAPDRLSWRWLVTLQSDDRVRIRLELDNFVSLDQVNSTRRRCDGGGIARHVCSVPAFADGLRKRHRNKISKTQQVKARNVAKSTLGNVGRAEEQYKTITRETRVCLT